MSRLRTTHSKGSDSSLCGAAARPDGTHTGSHVTRHRSSDTRRSTSCSGSAAGAPSWGSTSEDPQGATPAHPARPRTTVERDGCNATEHRERSPTGPHSARQPQVHLFSGRLSESCVLHDPQGRARPRCCLISVTACWSSTIESSSFLHFTASRKHFIAISSSAPLTLLRRVSTMSWL